MAYRNPSDRVSSQRVACNRMPPVCRSTKWRHVSLRSAYRVTTDEICSRQVLRIFDPEETSPGRGTSRGEIRDPLLSDADRLYRGGSPFSAKSSPISIRWSLNLERTLRHL